LATPEEQKIMLAKKEEMLTFFAEMELNIKKKLSWNFHNSNNYETDSPLLNLSDSSADTSLSSTNVSPPEQYYTLDSKPEVSLSMEDKKKKKSSYSLNSFSHYFLGATKNSDSNTNATLTSRRIRTISTMDGK